MKCKEGHDHRTVTEVRQCAAEKRSVAPTGPAYTDTLTEKQESFIRSLQEQVGEPVSEGLAVLTKKQASQEITRLKAKKEEMPKKENQTKGLPANISGSQVPQGTYTVVFDAASDDRITLRFREPKYGKWQGTQLVEYLAGPDNESDYIRCANWTEDGYRVWNRFKSADYKDSRIGIGIAHLSNADKEQQGEAGYVFSLASSRCYRCSRTLTVPASIHRGLGPECASIVGVA